jgi:hypothetical protein
VIIEEENVVLILSYFSFFTTLWPWPRARHVLKRIWPKSWSSSEAFNGIATSLSSSTLMQMPIQARLQHQGGSEKRSASVDNVSVRLCLEYIHIFPELKSNYFSRSYLAILGRNLWQGSRTSQKQKLLIIQSCGPSMTNGEHFRIVRKTFEE